MCGSAHLSRSSLGCVMNRAPSQALLDQAHCKTACPLPVASCNPKSTHEVACTLPLPTCGAGDAAVAVCLAAAHVPQALVVYLQAASWCGAVCLTYRASAGPACRVANKKQGRALRWPHAGSRHTTYSAGWTALGDGPPDALAWVQSETPCVCARQQGQPWMFDSRVQSAMVSLQSTAQRGGRSLIRLRRATRWGNVCMDSIGSGELCDKDQPACAESTAQARQRAPAADAWPRPSLHRANVPSSPHMWPSGLDSAVSSNDTKPSSVSSITIFCTAVAALGSGLAKGGCRARA